MSNLNAEFRRQVTVSKEVLGKAKGYVLHQNKHYLAESAVEVMRVGVQRYWSKHYNLRLGMTRQLALFQGGGELQLQVAKRKYKGKQVFEPSPNSKNFRSRKGNKRLVSFTFGKTKRHGNYVEAELKVHSFPMNLYERDVRLGGFAEGIIRKGTHIIRQHLANDTPVIVARNTARFQADLDSYCKGV